MRWFRYRLAPPRAVRFVIRSEGSDDNCFLPSNTSFSMFMEASRPVCAQATPRRGLDKSLAGTRGFHSAATP